MMKDATTLEISYFDIPNPIQNYPLRPSNIRETVFTDTYLLISEDKTLKKRDFPKESNRKPVLRFKEKLHILDNISYYANQEFEFKPDEDPLKSFIQINHLENYLNGRGIEVKKRRISYIIDSQATIHFTDLEVNKENHTNLTICSRTASIIKNIKLVLRLPANNLNYSSFLKKYEHS